MKRQWREGYSRKPDEEAFRKRSVPRMSESISMTQESGVFLHGSSVEVAGKGLIFLGHSTSGKSTIVKLLSQKFPIISDDKVYVFRVEGEWQMMCGDKWSSISNQRDHIPARESFSVLSFMRIFQSKRNEINEIGNLMLCKYIIDSVFEVERQRNSDDIDLKKKWFRLSVDLAKKNKGLRFDFKKESGIICLIDSTFKK